MTILAKTIEHSKSPEGIELITVQLMYPRFIHAEVMTHRVFSRNASSSRAIPVSKAIEVMQNDFAEPIHWGVNQPGMQAYAELNNEEKQKAIDVWHSAMLSAIEHAKKLMDIGVHKQVVNRILEPYSHISVIVTATEWSNFFALRVHADAQPEIKALGHSIQTAISSSQARLCNIGPDDPKNWHLPYISTVERESFSNPIFLAKLSAARCARVSYLTHDGKTPDIEKDLQLYDRLVGAAPIHASPIEHQASPLAIPKSWSGNFRGWHQYRKLVEVELMGLE